MLNVKRKMFKCDKRFKIQKKKNIKKKVEKNE